MPRRPSVLLVLSALAGSALAIPAARASEPAESTLTVPARPGQASVEWTGTVQPGLNPTSECTLPTDLGADTHELTLEVPPLTGVTYEVTFTIEWEPAALVNDLILTVVDAEGEVVANSDGGSPMERAIVQELPGGAYTVLVCGFASETPQDYTGSAVATTTPLASARLPAPADPRGLAFSAAVPADIQRDEGEPLIEIDGSGRIYTCGPTGFSQAEDYWQVSEDGGDQFHLLGEPPRGQQSLGGGGDCALATSPQPTDAGFHRVGYVGLSGLLEFATARSDDGGHTLTSNAFSLVGAGVDRQWITSSSEDRFFLNFNRILPQRRTEVCTSTDGGITYPACQPVSPSPLFPGPMRTIPAASNPFGDAPLVYYPWTDDDPNRVLLSVSLDDGETWSNCVIAETEGRPGLSFPVADHDASGENIYVVYADKADFNTYLTTVPVSALDRCDGPTDDIEAIPDLAAASPRTVVNREGVPTTVFPWVAAGGQPGRIAVTFYGTPTDVPADAPQLDDDPADDRTWDVYVNQSLDALSAQPGFSQVKATTHPNHYGQICLLGLGCAAGGDRSLVDFFAIDYNPDNGEVVVVFNRAHKRPEDVAGTVSTPLVFRQIAGPSNGGGTVSVPDRQPLRRVSADPTGDAIADYSSLFVPPRSVDTAGADLTRVEILPPVDPSSGEPLPDGGFTVRMHVEDLSDAALAETLQAASTPLPAQNLLFIFRYVDGFRFSAAVASWNPVTGFRFGSSEYVGNPGECVLVGREGEGDQCLLYPGGRAIPGAVDQEVGTITMTVPLAELEALRGLPARPSAFPEEVPAERGDRVYSASAFAVTNYASGDAQVQSWLYPVDNVPAFDFLIPEVGEVAAAPPPGRGEGRGGGRDDGAPLPATGGGAAAAVIGLLAVGGAVALRRR